MPRIPDRLLEGVSFLYPTVDEAARNERIGGTAFIVSRPLPRTSKILGYEASIPFLVSNRHVVWGAACSVARFNRRDGSTKIIEYGPEQWVEHPDGDDVVVACAYQKLYREEDQISSAAFNQLLSEEASRQADVGAGDDVLMIGRFINHQGRETIRPAVRFGNISMAPEKIWHPTLKRFQLSYAVEKKSRTGFSGSPVITYRQQGMSLVELPDEYATGWAVLGINWGHIFDEEGENTWLNGVVPAWKIMETLETPKMTALLEMADEMESKSISTVANPSVAGAEQELSTRADNPSHKEDFNSLLSSVAQGKPRNWGRTPIK